MPRTPPSSINDSSLATTAPAAPPVFCKTKPLGKRLAICVVVAGHILHDSCRVGDFEMWRIRALARKAESRGADYQEALSAIVDAMP